MARSKRVSRPKTLTLTLVILLAAATLFASIHFTVVAQTNLPNIVSYKVQGAVDFKNPGGESFWRGIPWTAVPLAASVSPGGGHTSELLVKSANTGYDAYLLFKWNDTAGPSFAGQTEVYQAANGSLIPLNPQTTATVKQLFYNSSYYYPDRLAVLWFVGSGSSRQTSPVMQLGTNGALTGGAADIWHWQSNPTDNNKNDAGFPGGYTNSAGKPIYPQDNLSFAEDDYTNMTGYYPIAGSIGNSSNLAPFANPFIVVAGTQYSTANKTWSVEMTRSFTTDAPKYQVQISSNSTYYVAFGVWQGKLGESSNLKSVSQWYALTISTQLPTSATVSAPTSGVTPLLAAVVAAGTFLVGVVIGSVILSYRKDPRRPSV